MQTMMRKLAGYAPPDFRRTASGLLLDLKSLPARLRDPERRREPWSTIHNVGNGDFRLVGAQIVQDLEDHAGLTPSSWVFDVGCGTGRAAERLAEVLGPSGRYVGFDISQRAFQLCRRRFRHDPRFHFAWADVRNGDYNRRGAVAESQAYLPAMTASVDVAFATSVFTHMQLPAVRHYLQQVHRVLRPGGRFMFTAFALEPGRRASDAFPFQPLGAHSAVLDRRSPERAIGHDRDELVRAAEAAGLQVVTFLRGCWAPGGEPGRGQDLFVAVKPSVSTQSAEPEASV